MALLAKYKNGNYTVKLYDDGTKIKYNDLDALIPDFAESIDCNITTKCNGGCKYCYLNCNNEGVHANLSHPVLDTLHRGTELAINGNDLTHPDLVDFLKRMKDKGVVVNMTINQRHFICNIDKLKDWQNKGLLHGIGVSLVDSADERLISGIQQLKNVVLHVIDGCCTKTDIDNLKDHNILLLILGFKHKGRGVDYYNENKDFVDNNIAFLKEHLYDYKKNFSGFVFDNLALADLDIRSKVKPELWEQNHMGEEGEFTFFLDLINNEYAVSSTETKYIFKIKENDTVDTMFKHIREIFKLVNKDVTT